MNRRLLKRLLLAGVAIALLFAVIPFWGAFNEYSLIAGAMQTDDVPDGYTPIYSAADFDSIRGNLSGKYFLMNDIDLSDYDQWIPIGNSQTKFSGVLDGNDHLITNLSIQEKMPDNQHLGLFGYAYNATIMNLSIEQSSIILNSDSTKTIYVGTICGYAENTTISNLFSSGSLSVTTATSVYVGGQIGYYKARQGTNKECINLETDTQITVDCSETAYVGGIFGGAFATNLSLNTLQSSGKMDVESKRTNSGGICGYYSYATSPSGDSFKCIDCNSKMNILYVSKSTSDTSTSYISGIVGYYRVSFQGIRINRCYNSGSLYADCRYKTTVYISGMLAYGTGSWDSSLNISECYNSGRISVAGNDTDSVAYAAGILGYYYNYGSGMNVNNCFNCGEICVEKTKEAYVSGIKYKSVDGGVGNYNRTSLCYNVGRLISKNNQTETIDIFGSSSENCYYLETTGYFTQGTALSYDKMRDKNNMPKLDFNKTWTYLNGDSVYPFPIFTNVDCASLPFVTESWKVGETAYASFEQSTGVLAFWGNGSVYSESNDNMPEEWFNDEVEEYLYPWTEVLPQVQLIDVQEGITAVPVSFYYRANDLQQNVPEINCPITLNEELDELRGIDIWNVHCGSTAEDCAMKKNQTYNPIEANYDPSYNWATDHIHMKNPEDRPIPEDFFIKMFGQKEAKKLIQNDYKNMGTTGQCFGIALVSGLLLTNTEFRNAFEPDQIVDLNYDDKYGNTDYTLGDIIQYAFIYQSMFYPNAVKKWCRIPALFIAEVEKYVNGEGNPLVLNIDKENGDNSYHHSVFAVGYYSDSEKIIIYLSDSNHPTYQTKLIFHINAFNLISNWIYDTGYNQYSASDGYLLSYNNCCYDDFLIELDRCLKQNENRQGERMVTSNNVFHLRASNNSIDFENVLFEIKKPNCNKAFEDSESFKKGLYWYINTPDIWFIAEDEKTEFSMIDNQLSVGAVLPKDASLQLEADELSSNYVLIKDAKNKTIEIVFSEYVDELNYSTIIEGVVSGDTVTAYETSTGILVTGLNDMTITYNVNDEVVAETTLHITDGREVTISVDENSSAIEAAHEHAFTSTTTNATCTSNGQTVSVCGICGKEKTETITVLGHAYVNHAAKEPTCEEPGWDAYQTCSRCSYTTFAEKEALGHIDEDEDGYCDREDCGEPMEGADLCPYCGKVHKGFFQKIVGFFHKLIYRLTHLFG